MMSRFVIMIMAGLTVLGVAAYGDSVPVAGSTSGGFTSTNTGTISADTLTWDFASQSNLVYSDANTSFGNPTSQNTPLDINLGLLTLTNGSNGGLGMGSHTAVLTLTVTFTDPSGGVATLPDTITLTVDNGNGDTKVALTSSPVGSFFLGGETYSVTIDGFYDSPSGGNFLSEISTLNPGGSAATIGTGYLRGTVTATGSSTTVVPEPGSISLLLTALGGVAFLLRRRCQN